MEQLVKEESQKLLAKQMKQAKIQRQIQVRQQALAWSDANRKKYEKAKEREIKKLASQVTEQAQRQAIQNLHHLTQMNDLVMTEIGMAHRAAAGYQNVERLKSLKRLKNEEVAKNRGSTAMIRLSMEKELLSAKSSEILDRKKEVRKLEDQKSQEMISINRRPLALSNPNIEARSSKQNIGPPEYQQSLAKTLRTADSAPGAERTSSQSKLTEVPRKKEVRKLEDPKSQEMISINRRPLALSNPNIEARSSKQNIGPPEYQQSLAKTLSTADSAHGVERTSSQSKLTEVPRKKEVRKLEDQKSQEMIGINSRPLALSNPNKEARSSKQRIVPSEFQKSLAKPLSTAASGSGVERTSSKSKVTVGPRRTSSDLITAFSSTSMINILSVEKPKGRLEEMVKVKVPEPRTRTRAASGEYESDVVGTLNMRTNWMSAVSKEEDQTGSPYAGQAVRYYDSMYPNREVKYFPPPGLTQREESWTSPDAWEKGRELSEQIEQELGEKEQRQKEIEERRKERSERALLEERLSKQKMELENKIKDIIDPGNMPLDVSSQRGLFEQGQMKDFDDEGEEMEETSDDDFIAVVVDTDDFIVVDTDEEYIFPGGIDSADKRSTSEGIPRSRGNSLKSAPQSYATNPRAVSQEVKDKRKGSDNNTGSRHSGQAVRNYDSMYPNREVKHLPPSGLVQREESSSSPDAWEKGRKLSGQIEQEQGERAQRQKEFEEKQKERSERALLKKRLSKEKMKLENKIKDIIDPGNMPLDVASQRGLFKQEQRKDFDDEGEEVEETSSDDFIPVDTDEEYIFPGRIDPRSGLVLRESSPPASEKGRKLSEQIEQEQGGRVQRQKEIEERRKERSEQALLEKRLSKQKLELENKIKDIIDPGKMPLDVASQRGLSEQGQKKDFEEMEETSSDGFTAVDTDAEGPFHSTPDGKLHHHNRLVAKRESDLKKDALKHYMNKIMDRRAESIENLPVDVSPGSVIKVDSDFGTPSTTTTTPSTIHRHSHSGSSSGSGSGGRLSASSSGSGGEGEESSKSQNGLEGIRYLPPLEPSSSSRDGTTKPPGSRTSTIDDIADKMLKIFDRGSGSSRSNSGGEEGQDKSLLPKRSSSGGKRPGSSSSYRGNKGLVKPSSKDKDFGRTRTRKELPKVSEEGSAEDDTGSTSTFTTVAESHIVFHPEDLSEESPTTISSESSQGRPLSTSGDDSKDTDQSQSRDHTTSDPSQLTSGSDPTYSSQSESPYSSTEKSSSSQYDTTGVTESSVPESEASRATAPKAKPMKSRPKEASKPISSSLNKSRRSGSGSAPEGSEKVRSRAQPPIISGAGGHKPHEGQSSVDQDEVDLDQAGRARGQKQKKEKERAPVVKPKMEMERRGSVDQDQVDLDQAGRARGQKQRKEKAPVVKPKMEMEKERQNQRPKSRQELRRDKTECEVREEALRRILQQFLCRKPESIEKMCVDVSSNDCIQVDSDMYEDSTQSTSVTVSEVSRDSRMESNLDETKKAALRYFHNLLMNRRPESIDKLPVTVSSGSMIEVDSEYESGNVSFNSCRVDNNGQNSCVSVNAGYRRELTTVDEERSEDVISTMSTSSSYLYSRVTRTQTKIPPKEGASPNISEMTLASPYIQGNAGDDESFDVRLDTRSEEPLQLRNSTLRSSSDSSFPDAGAMLQQIIDKGRRPRPPSEDSSGPEKEMDRAELLEEVTPVRLWETPQRQFNQGENENDSEQISMVFGNLRSVWKNVKISPPPWYSDQN